MDCITHFAWLVSCLSRSLSPLLSLSVCVHLSGLCHCFALFRSLGTMRQVAVLLGMALVLRSVAAMQLLVDPTVRLSPSSTCLSLDAFFLTTFFSMDPVLLHSDAFIPLWFDALLFLDCFLLSLPRLISDTDSSTAFVSSTFFCFVVFHALALRPFLSTLYLLLYVPLVLSSFVDRSFYYLSPFWISLAVSGRRSLFLFVCF